MRKNLLLPLILLLASKAFSQTNLVIEAPLHNNSQSGLRAMNGTAAQAFFSAVYLVKQSELFNVPTGVTLTSFGYTMNVGTTGTPVTGNYTLYLQNTTDVTYLKGTSFSAALAGMTTVYASVLTIPVSAVTTSVMVTLSTPFVYSGGGLYVAFDWDSAGPFASAGALYLGETTELPLPGGGGATSFSNLSAQNTLTLTNARPSFLFGFTNPNANDIEVLKVMAPGRVSSLHNTPHTVVAAVRNIGTATQNNISVTLNVGGANTFMNTQTIASLAPGAVTQVSFAPFNPQLPGLNSMSVSVPSDLNTLNNTALYAQSVTCNEWSLNPPAGTFSINQVGFAAGAGILGTSFFAVNASSISAIRAAISTNTPAIGQQVYGVLLSNAGAVVATTNTITLTTAMLGTFITFTFSTPVAMTANTSYYLGMAQMTGSQAYHPYGTLGSHYLPFMYYYSGIAGGAMTLLTSNFGYFGIEGVFVPDIPGLSATANPTLICTGNTSEISATGAANYTWTGPGASNTQSFVTPAFLTPGPVNYTVAATNSLGCSAQRVVLLGVQNFTSMTTNPVYTVCLGSSVNLSAGGATSYTWETGTNTFNTQTISVSPLVNETYTVTGANVTGCLMTSIVDVEVETVNLSVSPSTAICLGAQITLTAQGAVSYLWNNIAPFSQYQDTPGASAQYTVTGTGANGCVRTETVNVTVNPNPTVTAVASRSVVCRNSTNTLTATGADNYSWSNNQTTASVVVTAPNTLPQTYTVTGTDANGCKHAATVSFIVDLCAGVANHQAGSFRIYPNPGAGILMIETGAEEPVVMILYNAVGQQVFEIRGTGPELRADFSHLPGGVYLGELRGGSGTVKTARIIKE